MNKNMTNFYVSNTRSCLQLSNVDRPLDGRRKRLDLAHWNTIEQDIPIGICNAST